MLGGVWNGPILITSRAKDVAPDGTFNLTPDDNKDTAA